MRLSVPQSCSLNFTRHLLGTAAITAILGCSTTTLAQQDPAAPEAARPASREVDLAPVGGIASSPPASAVISEGAVVTMMPGTILWDAKGGLIFKPDAATNATADGQVAAFSQPASLLPCAALARFESMLGVGIGEPAAGTTNPATPPESAKATTDGAASSNIGTRELGRYFVNGQVFAFHGKPYILLSVPPSTGPVAPPATADAAPSTTQKETQPTAGPPKPLGEAADVQSLITDLESRRTTARALETAATLNQSKAQTGTPTNTETSAPSTNAATPTTARPDGQHINGRQGRVVRHDAWLIFTPDSGSRSPSDAPLVLLPSAQMERLEGLVSRHGDSARYRISGKLITYKGRQFLLPTLAQVMPPSDLSPGH
jgi:hypothetical protein